MITETKDMLWDFILANEIATVDELSLVTRINGYNEETMMDIIFSRTGLHSIEQCYEGGSFWCANELLSRFDLLPEESEEDDD